MLGRFDYEVALEILGQSKQPLVQLRHEELKKENPNEKLLEFIRSRLAVIDDFMEVLDTDDEYLIKRILDKEDMFRKAV